VKQPQVASVVHLSTFQTADAVPAIDAVDGISTGTWVPWKWVLSKSLLKQQCLLMALRVIRRDAPFLVAIGCTADKRSRQPWSARSQM